MNVDKMVPYTNDRSKASSKTLTLRDVLVCMQDVAFSGDLQLAEALASPEEVLEQLVSNEHVQFPALLFCGDIKLHDNGSEYVSALRLKGRREIVVEKYFLDDPMLPSFSFALRY